jgi:hypothetical protein
VEAAEPSPGDLAGLLAGPGHLVRMGGTARISVGVDAAWRVHVLIAELSARGLEVTWAPVPATAPDADRDDQDADHRAPGEDRVDLDEHYVDLDEHYVDPDEGESDPGYSNPGYSNPGYSDPGYSDPGDRDADGDGPDAGDAEPVGDDTGQDGGTGSGGSPGWGVARFEVRTAYSSLLAGLARAWLVGSAKRAPDRFFLTGPRLRLWAAASGIPEAGGYLLGLDPDDGPEGWAKIDAALARAGLAGVVTDGPAYRISGGKRLARLAELVGERPPTAPPESWPGVWRA